MWPSTQTGDGACAWHRAGTCVHYFLQCTPHRLLAQHASTKSMVKYTCMRACMRQQLQKEVNMPTSTETHNKQRGRVTSADGRKERWLGSTAAAMESRSIGGVGMPCTCPHTCVVAIHFSTRYVAWGAPLELNHRVLRASIRAVHTEWRHVYVAVQLLQCMCGIGVRTLRDTRQHQGQHAQEAEASVHIIHTHGHEQLPCTPSTIFLQYGF